MSLIPAWTEQTGLCDKFPVVERSISAYAEHTALQLVLTRRRRSIPACAGETISEILTGFSVSVDPRGRGGDNIRAVWRAFLSG